MSAKVIAISVLYLAALTVWAGWACEVQRFVRILDRLRIRRGVWIEHPDGEVRAQFLRRNAFGETWCHAYGTAGVAVLLPNGEVRQPSYVKRWKHIGGLR